MLYINLLNYESSKRIGTLSWVINIVEILVEKNLNISYLVSQKSNLNILLCEIGVKKNQIIILNINNGFFKHFQIQFSLIKFTKLNDYIFTPYVGGLYLNFGRKQIMVIHDLAWFNDKEKYSIFKRFILKLSTKLLAQNCFKIITVSEWSKNDIKNTLKITVDYVIPNTLTSILNLNSNMISDSICQEYPHLIFQKYVLSIGTIQNGKNYFNSAKIFERSLAKKGFKYIIIGDYKEKSKIVKSIKKKFKNTIITGYLEDEVMFYLLKNCDGYVNLSFYEGFGIPLLDAVLFNKPALISDNSALVDLALSTHCIVNPYDDEAIKKGFMDFTKKSPDKVETEKLLFNYSRSNVSKLISVFFDEVL